MRPWVDPDRSYWVRKPRRREDWRRLAREYTGRGDPGPLDHILKVVAANGCRTVVIENRYLDVDYRSEYTAFWSLKFDNISPFTRRLHFFGADLDPKSLHKLSAAARRSYLGYSILRPIPHGRVGRTVISPPRELCAETLTTITDRVSLFGNPLEVEGVPFCEQDSEFLRCAHAAAWICHYTAARRGHLGRRPTARIVELSPSELSPERQFPSNGLNNNQLQVVFNELDQPALLYGMSALPRVIGVRDPICPDTIVLERSGGATLHPRAKTPAGHWDERMISIICRYLNSGFPVLIGAEDHAFVLVGWRRDLEGQVQFVACDDTVGPYEIIPSPFEHYMTPWETIMVPLPPRVYLSGESAEGRAHRVFRTFAEQASQLADIKGELASGEIELRSILRPGPALKEDIGRLTSSPGMQRLVRHARLPRWVWVVEAHRRRLCGGRKRCVVAMAVFDSTAFDSKPRLDLLAVLGSVVAFPPEAGKKIEAEGDSRPWSSLINVH